MPPRHTACWPLAPTDTGSCGAEDTAAARQPRGLPPSHRLLAPQGQGGPSCLKHGSRRRSGRSQWPAFSPARGPHVRCERRPGRERAEVSQEENWPHGSDSASGKARQDTGFLGGVLGPQNTWRPTTSHSQKNSLPGGRTALGVTQSLARTPSARSPVDIFALSVLIPRVVDAAGRRQAGRGAGPANCPGL